MTVKTALAILTYCGAIVLANWLVTIFGQAALPYTAFILIPFDLVLRDLLQDKWQSSKRWQVTARMSLLIFGGGLLSFLTTTASLRIAVASCVAFCATGILDAVTYQKMLKRGRFFRINAATLCGALTDSVLFSNLAFDEVSWALVGWQTGSKVVGGIFWSLVFLPLFRGRAGSPTAQTVQPNKGEKNRVYAAENFQV